MSACAFCGDDIIPPIRCADNRNRCLACAIAAGYCLLCGAQLTAEDRMDGGAICAACDATLEEDLDDAPAS